MHVLHIFLVDFGKDIFKKCNCVQVFIFTLYFGCGYKLV